MATRRERKMAHGRPAPTTIERAAVKKVKADIQKQLYGTIPMQVSRSNQQRYQPLENNFVDLASASYVADTTGTIALIATIAQGAGQQQRVGKKSQYKSIQMRGFVGNNAAALYNKATVLIIYDRRPQSVLPAMADVLNTPSSLSFPNDSNTGRFKTLLRRDYDLQGAPSITTGTADSTHNVEEYVKCNKPVVFKQFGTGAIGDIEEGALYVVTVGNSAAGTTAAAFTLGFRVRYHE